MLTEEGDGHKRLIGAFWGSSPYGAGRFMLNGHAFALHVGNVHLARITDILGTLGVQQHLKRVTRSSTFKAYLQLREPERNWSDLSDAEVRSLLKPIDDLVQRRNDVSHGAFRTDQLASVSLLIDRCGFVRAYASGLFEVMVQDAIMHAANLGAARPLGKPLRVFNNRIVCFEAPSALALGDCIFAITDDSLEPVRHSQVARLEVDNAALQHIDSSTPVRFGVEVAFRADERHSFFASNIDGVW